MSSDNKVIKTMNPATGEIIQEYEVMTKEEVNDKVKKAWNFPYWQALRFAAPSLMIGNTIVLKPARATMQCGIEIEKAFKKAGLPNGVFQTLVGDSSIAETLIDSDVNAVTFTGSVPVGAKLHKELPHN